MFFAQKNRPEEREKKAGDTTYKGGGKEEIREEGGRLYTMCTMPILREKEVAVCTFHKRPGALYNSFRQNSLRLAGELKGEGEREQEAYEYVR